MLQSMYFSYVTGFINLILNFILIPKIGLIGVIYSKIGSMLFSFLFRYFYLIKNRNFVPINIAELLKIFIIYCLFIIFFKNYVDLKIILNLSLKTFLATGMIIIFYFKNKTFFQEFILSDR